MSAAVKVAFSLGGNLGDVAAAFYFAVDRLGKAGLKELRRSSIYRTKPVGFEIEVQDFFNAAVSGIWIGTLESLHLECRKIECAAGRPEDHAFRSSRTLDIDILLFGDEIVSTESLTIPHPEAKNRFFVLSPLNEICSDWRFPDDGLSVNDALEALRKSSGFSEIVSIEDWSPL